MTHPTSGRAPVRRAGSIALNLVHAGILSAGFAFLVAHGLPESRSAIALNQLVEVSDSSQPASSAGADIPLDPAFSAAISGADGIQREEPAAAVAVAQTASQEISEILFEVDQDAALSEEMQRVRDWVSRRYRVSPIVLEPVLAQAEDSARSHGLDPLLIVAMMAIESSFNPFAESHMGAQGLMQVIPRYHQDKIGEGAGEDALFDPVLNVQVGTMVLVEGIRRFGDLQAALQYYGGARNDPKLGYSRKVLAMRDRISSAARASEAGDA